MTFFQDLGHRITDLVQGEDHDNHHPQQKNVQPDDDHNCLLDDEDEEALEAARQEYSSIKPSPQFRVGPILRFTDIDVERRRWKGSALVVTERHDPPRLVIRHKNKTAHSKPIELDTWEGNIFYRYDIELKIGEEKEKYIEYWFETELGRTVDEPQKWNFYVPSLKSPFNWAFYSCNGFTSDVEDPEKNFH
ncbi:hypothetical protein BGZ65_009876, partial [Modicella reniformis]